MLFYQGCFSYKKSPTFFSVSNFLHFFLNTQAYLSRHISVVIFIEVWTFSGSVKDSNNKVYTLLSDKWSYPVCFLWIKYTDLLSTYYIVICCLKCHASKCLAVKERYGGNALGLKKCCSIITSVKLCFVFDCWRPWWKLCNFLCFL